MKKEIAYLIIYLAKCAINGETPDVKYLEGVNMDELYDASFKHKVSGTLCVALQKCGKATPKFTNMMLNTTRQNIMMDAEARNIYKFMEDNGIWFMPVKGELIEKYYPARGMRTRSDCDILYDTTYDEKLRDFFISRGYEVTHFREQVEDVYKKAPVFYFEMHRTLFDEKRHANYAGYYNAKLPELFEGQGYHKKLNYNDSYIFSAIHNIKHLLGKGVGFRLIFDEYVLLKAGEKNGLDLEYVDNEIAKAGVLDSEHLVRNFTTKLMEAPFPTEANLTEEEQNFLDELCESGVYGTFDIKIKHTLNNYQKDGSSKFGAKFKMIMKGLFPNASEMKKRFPVLKKCMILLPFCYIIRLFTLPFKKKARAKAKMISDK